MKAGFFLQKGKPPPHQSRQKQKPSGRADGTQGRQKKKTEDGRRRTSGIRRSRKQASGIRNQAIRHQGRQKEAGQAGQAVDIYFPLEIISIVRYRPIEIAIQK